MGMELLTEIQGFVSASVLFIIEAAIKLFLLAVFLAGLWQLASLSPIRQADNNDQGKSDESER
jgi:hypothetical protein